MEKKSDAKWLRCAEAMQYFGIRRAQLDKIAGSCGGKKKLAPKCVVYDISAIENYIRNL